MTIKMINTTSIVLRCHFINKSKEKLKQVRFGCTLNPWVLIKKLLDYTSFFEENVHLLLLYSFDPL